MQLVPSSPAKHYLGVRGAGLKLRCNRFQPISQRFERFGYIRLDLRHGHTSRLARFMRLVRQQQRRI